MNSNTHEIWGRAARYDQVCTPSRPSPGLQRSCSNRELGPHPFANHVIWHATSACAM